MQEKANKADELKKAKVEELQKEYAKTSTFMKIWKYNEPKYYLIYGIVGCFFAGAIFPIFGIQYSFVISMLTQPMYLLPVTYHKDFKDDFEKPEDFVMRMLNNTVIWMIALAACSLFGFIIRFIGFGTLSENVTQSVRKELYAAVLEKHMGWFDNRDHATGVITSTMAEQTMILNDAATSGIQPVLTGIVALSSGVIIGFYYCW